MQPQKQLSYIQNQNEMDIEEALGNIPSSDSDKEGEVQKKWDAAKILYKEMDTPTPGDDQGGKNQMMKNLSEKNLGNQQWLH